MKTIAITGYSLTGKSTLISKTNLDSIDLDKIIASLYNDENIQKELDVKIGATTKKGVLRAITESPNKLPILEKILHPQALIELKDKLEELKSIDCEIVLVEVPLLFEVNWQKMFDYTIVIYADDLIISQREKETGLILPNAMKQRRLSQKQIIELADFKVNTSSGTNAATNEFLSILGEIKNE